MADTNPVNQVVDGVLKLTKATGQVVIQPGNTGTSLTITAANPAVASRTITLPDPGANANLILSTSAQTISGALTLSAAPTLTAAANQLVFQRAGAGNTITLNASTPAVNSIVSVIDPGAAAAIMAYNPMGRSIVANAATALLTGDDGRVILVAQTSQYQITLPDPAVGNAGLTYTFIVSNAANFDVTIRATANGVMRLTGVTSAVGAVANGADQNSITLVGNVAAVGDKIVAVSTGARWFCTSIMAAAGGVTCP